MKRLLALICGATLVLTAAGASVASAEPGPETGNSEKGLCTAYFNGQKNGHDKDGDGWTDNENSPFSALETRSEDDGENEEEDVPGETEIYSDVFEYCDSLYVIGGQPEHNGRYDCRTEDGAPRDTDDSDGDGVQGDGEYECLLNTGEGDTGGDHPSGK